jgi:hypothetical protein
VGEDNALDVAVIENADPLEGAVPAMEATLPLLGWKLMPEGREPEASWNEIFPLVPRSTIDQLQRYPDVQPGSAEV